MVEEERWVMHGLSADDPNCIKSAEQLQEYIEKIGFLPLFRNEIPGFSVEEHTAADSWWSEDPERDPWEWRKIIAGNGSIPLQTGESHGSRPWSRCINQGRSISAVSNMVLAIETMSSIGIL